MDRDKRKTMARQLRQNQTKAEDLLWKQLRSRKLSEYKFRRQFPIEGYFADFCCLRHKLIIELDGGHHADQADYDENRTEALKQNGFTVLRFWNSEVLNETDRVLNTILSALLVSKIPSPFSGEGGSDAQRSVLGVRVE